MIGLLHLRCLGPYTIRHCCCAGSTEHTWTVGTDHPSLTECVLMCVWATWCRPLVFAYHLPTACLGRGSCKVSALQLRTSGCWGAPNWHSALLQHAARRWACIPQSTYSTRMRQSIALWLLAWISLKVVLYSVSQLVTLRQSSKINSNTTLHKGSW